MELNSWKVINTISFQQGANILNRIFVLSIKIKYSENEISKQGFIAEEHWEKEKEPLVHDSTYNAGNYNQNDYICCLSHGISSMDSRRSPSLSSIMWKPYSKGFMKSPEAPAISEHKMVKLLQPFYSLPGPGHLGCRITIQHFLDE